MSSNAGSGKEIRETERGDPWCDETATAIDAAKNQQRMVISVFRYTGCGARVMLG